jgi:hypothetical protein
MPCGGKARILYVLKAAKLRDRPFIARQSRPRHEACHVNPRPIREDRIAPLDISLTGVRRPYELGML